LQGSQSFTSTSSFNATRFAFGFAGHMLVDMPAFATKNSYLVHDLPNWMNVWMHMNIIDAIIGSENPVGTFELGIPPEE
jgi:hypothetical protein